MGFTGVDWAARPADRLAADLAGGAGVRAGEDAVVAWGRLAKAYAELALDLNHIIHRLRIALGDGHSKPIAGLSVRDGSRPNNVAHEGQLGPLISFARWAAEHSAKLAEVAARTSGQASAFEVSLLAMPGVADLAVLTQARQLLSVDGAIAGGVLLGELAKLEHAEAQAHSDAVAVMEGYEAASRPFAQPWSFSQPPSLVTENATKPKGGSGTTGSRGVGGGGGGGISVPTAPLGGYAPASLARGSESGGRNSVPAATSGSSPRSMSGIAPLMGAAHPGAGANTTRGRSLAASPSADDDSTAYVVHADTEFAHQTAPGVVGAFADSGEV